MECKAFGTGEDFLVVQKLASAVSKLKTNFAPASWCTSVCFSSHSEDLHSNIFPISKGPSIVEKEVQKGSCQYAKDIGKKIMNVQHFSQEPQDSNVCKQTCAGGDMILKHSFKIFNFTLSAPIMPGPQIVEHIVTYYGKLNSYKAGEKIIYLENFGEEPQKKHIHQKSRRPHQAKLQEPLKFLILSD